jgi:glycosyltransferase involved in cell wall biosynthesis
MPKKFEKIYFILPYPTGVAPSQRFRFEQYYDILKKEGFTFHISSFLDKEAWDILYKQGKYLSKTIKVLAGFARRFADLFKIPAYDVVFIHREAAPIGPPVFEWIIAKALKKKIIYDFDDAIWLSNTSDNNSIVAGLKWHSKVRYIIKWSYKVSCGNAYLADYARQYNKNVVVNPTTIDTISLHNQIKNQHTDSMTIGWTGTHSTAQYLDNIIPIIEKLEKTYDFTFEIISNVPPNYTLKSLKYTSWSKDTEIEDLLRFNIGVMPLTDDKWSKGKCGFKALQYMSLGIPALVSPVGVNTSIVDDGINGMICRNAHEWEQAIEKLLTDKNLKSQLGINARKKIEAKYSVISNTENFIRLFEDQRHVD